MSNQESPQAMAARIRALEEALAERDKTIAVLTEEEKRYSMLENNTSDLIHSVTPEGRFLFVNRAWKETLGYGDEDLARLKLMDIVDQGCKGKCEGIFQELISGQRIDRTDTVFIAKDGRKIAVEGRCSTTFVDGRAVAMTGIFRDLSERQLSEEALRQSEERYRNLFENATDMIQLLEPTGRLRYVNRAWQETFGYSADDLGELSIFDIIDQDCQDHCDLTFHRILEAPVVNRIDSVFKSRDGRKILVEGNAICKFVDGKPNLIQCIFRDVTEKRKMEAELNKAQKIESLGVLAGGIAHDFNNLLTAIVGNVSLAKLRVNPADRVYTYLENTEQASLRAKGLTQQLLTFSKGGAPIKRTTAIGDLVVDSSTFTLRGSNVNCRYQIADDLWAVDVDEGQLSQVVQNLVINASQAMAQGGTLGIKAANRTIGPGEIPPLPAGRYVELRFVDQGCGIPKESLSKIFDPYFTSKPSGNGLGLAISYSIIKKHEGLILVESTLGEGTTFTIYLPAVGPATVEQAVGEGVETASGGRILVMDDDQFVLETLTEMLRFLGCEVTVASDGVQVIALYEQARTEQRPFAAVIMDLTIPGGMGGVETLARLRVLDPEVRALVSSGYANNPVMSNCRAHGFCGVIAKPFRVEELSKALGSVLNVNASLMVSSKGSF